MNLHDQPPLRGLTRDKHRSNVLAMPLVVNGEEIPDQLVQEEFGQIKSYYERTTQVSCCDRDDEFLEKARQNLIGRALVTQEALRVVPNRPFRSRPSHTRTEEETWRRKTVLREHGTRP